MYKLQGSQTDRSVQSSVDKQDMRKVGTSHGSQKLSINFNFGISPAVVKGRQEQFGYIFNIITYWEEMENGEEGKKDERQHE